jgi:hypothetical protein
MPLNWKALYPQIPRLAEAEVERRLRLAEQASATAEELAIAWRTQTEAESAAKPSPNGLQFALTWLGAAIRAWNAVLECYSEDRPEYQAAWQKRQRLQQILLALLRQTDSGSRY